MSTPQERRRYPRAEVRWPVAIQGTLGLMDGEAKDVSFGGAFFHCRNPLKLNEVFGIFINVPELSRPLKTTAEVVWSNVSGPDDEINPHGMGVKFRDIY